MIKLSCECGTCDREHDFFDEYYALHKIQKKIETKGIILLKDCDNGDYPLFLIAETEHLKMGVSLPKGTDVLEFVFEEFQPLSKTVWN